ncbi:Cof-type HAD-IIB family hydrolase [Salibacterium salarium]|uniref:Cof-type HAD-IIB family hydrolase n=1 Tax=Salibacterium salarium TaxID=284579 RepID=A0A3R9PZL8_9BACI|nr:Cof-type HAD-IIB family hydrolase [Salibacterium salarium]RSL30428.1 Cof-type HAD-IIB family hydrolase [Salibacterium salarium]
MKKPSIVFFDIDGTLYTEEMIIPLSAKKAIQALQDKGVYVAIATGRAPFMFETLRQELGIKTFVSFNGSYVVADGELIDKKPLEVEKVAQLHKEAGESEHPMVFLDHEQAAADVENHDHIVKGMGDLKMAYPPLDKDYYKNSEIYQALLFCGTEAEKRYQTSYDTFRFVRWHQLAVDVLPSGGSKAEGLRAVANHLGYTMEETAAFGDALNDMEMLKEAGIGIAMGNALEAVKQNADIVTAPVYEDGVKQGLERIGLL